MRKETCLKVISLLLFTTSTLFAQEGTNLSGTISAPSIEGAFVNIINSTQKTGTVNSDSGSFQIMVRENDELLFSSIQYKNITVVVTSEILEEGFLEITLTEDLNVLDEVNISNINLTGNIATDISNIEIVEDLPLNISFGAIKDIPFEADINDPAEAPRNRAFESNEIIKPGANLLGLADVAIGLLGLKKKGTVRVYKAPTKTSSEQLKELFQENFFTNTLDLKKEQINDFVFFADDHGLKDLLEKSNKLALIEFLIDQSKKYNLEFAKN